MLAGDFQFGEFHGILSDMHVVIVYSILLSAHLDLLLDF